MTNIFQAFHSLRCTDWDDVGSVAARCAPIFDSLEAEPGTIPALLERLADDSHLQSLCERFDFFDKLVVHDDVEAKIRVRIHLFVKGYFDRPHNHRWTFASLLLSGSYLHQLFGRDEAFGEDTDVDSLKPIMERTEQAGSRYALHHNSVHAVRAANDTISIVVRGPAAKQRSLILDRANRGSFWVYSAGQESAELLASRAMSPVQREAACERVLALSGRRLEPDR